VSWLSLSRVSVALVLAGCVKNEIRVVSTTDNCVSVGLGRLSVAEPDGERLALIGYAELEFRRVPGNGRGVLVAPSARTGTDEQRWYSEKKFAFDLSDPRRLRTAEETEWRKSAVAALHRRPAGDNLDRNGAVAGPELEHGGRMFPRAGKEWASPPALLSPNGRWLALQSYDPKPRQRFAIEVFRGVGGLPNDGNFYAEVYDAGTGLRKARVHASFANVSADTVWSRNGWLTDRHFVAPRTHLYLENFVICEIPEGR